MIDKQMQGKLFFFRSLPFPSMSTDNDVTSLLDQSVNIRGQMLLTGLPADRNIFALVANIVQSVYGLCQYEL